MIRIYGPAMKNPEEICAYMFLHNRNLFCKKENIMCIHPYCGNFASKNGGRKYKNYYGHYEMIV